MMNQKGLAPIFLIIGFIVFIVISYTFFVRPFSVPQNAIVPLNKGGIILAEKATYLFRSPEVGERILFIPKDTGMEYVGIITKINDNQNIKIYTIVSTGTGVPWEVSRDKIIWKVYFPFISKEIISSTLSSLNSPKPSPLYENIEITLLSTVWDGQLVTYSDSNLSLTFQYPSVFTATNYNPEKDIEFTTIIKSPQIDSSKIINNETFDWVTYENNTMFVDIYKLGNPDNLSLYDFIADRYKTYPGNGVVETFETFKQYLKPYNLPKEGSYIFEGITGENPVKKIYFEDKEKVYVFNLLGGGGTGAKYSEDAEKIFENILKSIKFTN